ncbi:MAG: hypothetical protein ABFS10_07900 [Bacteroidota bacterium]
MNSANPKKPSSISDLPGIPFEYGEVLKSRGIRNTSDFTEKVKTAEQRRAIARLTGIPEERLLEIYRLCDPGGESESFRS